MSGDRLFADTTSRPDLTMMNPEGGADKPQQTEDHTDILSNFSPPQPIASAMQSSDFSASDNITLPTITSDQPMSQTGPISSEPTTIATSPTTFGSVTETLNNADDAVMQAATSDTPASTESASSPIGVGTTYDPYGNKGDFPQLSTYPSYDNASDKPQPFQYEENNTYQSEFTDSQLLSGTRFKPEGGYRDLPWGFAFIVHLLIVFIFFCIGASNTHGRQDDGFKPADARTIGLIGLVCAIVGSALAVVYILIMKLFAKQLIWSTVVLYILSSIMVSVVLFNRSDVVGGLIFLVFAVAGIAYGFVWRRHIEYATALLQTAAGLVQQYPGCIQVAILGTCAQVLWLIFWVFAAAGALTYTPAGQFFVELLLLLSFFWTFQVIKNCVRTTIAGVIASWYFLSTSGSMPSNVTQASAKRALTTSFGSICMGSLLTATVSVLRHIVEGLQRRLKQSYFTCILTCAMMILEQLVEMFNQFAFCHIAMYGKTYVTAAKDAWRLIRERGVDKVIQDDIINDVLTLGTLIVAGCTACIGGSWAYHSLDHENHWTIGSALGFFVGFAVAKVMVELITSVTTALFVCFAEEPETLGLANQMLYERILTTYQEVLNLGRV